MLQVQVGSSPVGLPHMPTEPSVDGIHQRPVVGITEAIPASAIRDDGFGGLPGFGRFLGLAEALEQDLNEQEEALLLDRVPLRSNGRRQCSSPVMDRRAVHVVAIVGSDSSGLG